MLLKVGENYGESFTVVHMVFKKQYHYVFVTKYRRKVLKGEVGLEARELIRQTCGAFEIEILKGVVSLDHYFKPIGDDNFGTVD